jgi:8-oxo-dGTP pyrophosphatase MutT (NUDIX family)
MYNPLIIVTITHKMSLKSVARMPQTSSTCIWVCVRTKAGCRILTTKEKRHNHTKMGFPGGLVDTVNGTKERTWDAVRREWKEETGLSFPDISFPGTSDFLRFVWTHSNGSTTGIYVGFTTDNIPLQNFVPNSEIAGLHLTLVSDIKAAIAGKGNFEVRECAKASTMAILQAIGWD